MVMPRHNQQGKKAFFGESKMIHGMLHVLYLLHRRGTKPVNSENVDSTHEVSSRLNRSFFGGLKRAAIRDSKEASTEDKSSKRSKVTECSVSSEKGRDKRPGEPALVVQKRRNVETNSSHVRWTYYYNSYFFINKFVLVFNWYEWDLITCSNLCRFPSRENRSPGGWQFLVNFSFRINNNYGKLILTGYYQQWRRLWRKQIQKSQELFSSSRPGRSEVSKSYLYIVLQAWFWSCSCSMFGFLLIGYFNGWYLPSSGWSQWNHKQ